MRNSLFRKKRIDQLVAAIRGEKALKRELSAFDLTMLGIGAKVCLLIRQSRVAAICQFCLINAMTGS
ncbi:hypothetical protein JO375_11290 [Paenibacillus sp. UY79]|nr:hypothetical protein [Paenibacillus farraposensis]